MVIRISKVIRDTCKNKVLEMKFFDECAAIYIDPLKLLYAVAAFRTDVRGDHLVSHKSKGSQNVQCTSYC
ncbi:unnamed protein product [Larinioides sclopetarius]|uniref:Uncharacterized protein n=1 Tax=Larinioides sclopetarius TaxID=280406 RepID=A0AAV1ZLI0_9ARAC